MGRTGSSNEDLRSAGSSLSDERDIPFTANEFSRNSIAGVGVATQVVSDHGHVESALDMSQCTA
jgi:hypothetical protein